MANKKEINQKTGGRLQALIKELNMTQGEFGNKIGLGSRQISCIVRGERRLTEDNARIIAKLFPPVRMEWLMGWDDYITTIDYESNKVLSELGGIYKDYIDHYKKVDTVSKILRVFQYDFYRTSVSYDERKRDKESDEYNTLIDILNSDNRYIKEVFTEQGWDEIKNMCFKLIHSHSNINTEINTADREKKRQEDRDFKQWMINNAGELYSKHILQAQSSVESMYRQEYTLFGDDGNVVVQFDANEKDSFINELYDVVTALIQYHITKGKKKGQP